MSKRSIWIILGGKFQLKLTILIFWTKFSPKRVLSTKNRKSKHHHWILHIWISLHGKCRLKLTIFIFWTKFFPKRVLPTKNRNSKSHHWVLHIGISLGTQFQLKLTTLIFWTEVGQEVCFQLIAEKSHFCVSPWSLLIILNISAWGPTDTAIFQCLFSF